MLFSKGKQCAFHYLQEKKKILAERHCLVEALLQAFRSPTALDVHFNLLLWSQLEGPALGIPASPKRLELVKLLCVCVSVCVLCPCNQLEAAFESGWDEMMVEPVKALHSWDLAQENASEHFSFE